MNTYTTEARITLSNGKEAVFSGTVEAVSYREAFNAALASFPDGLEKQGIRGSGGVTIRVWGPNMPESN